MRRKEVERCAPIRNAREATACILVHLEMTADRSMVLAGWTPFSHPKVTTPPPRILSPLFSSYESPLQAQRVGVCVGCERMSLVMRNFEKQQSLQGSWCVFPIATVVGLLLRAAWAAWIRGEGFSTGPSSLTGSWTHLGDRVNRNLVKLGEELFQRRCGSGSAELWEESERDELPGPGLRYGEKRTWEARRSSLPARVS